MSFRGGGINNENTTGTGSLDVGDRSMYNSTHENSSKNEQVCDENSGDNETETSQNIFNATLYESITNMLKRKTNDRGRSYKEEWDRLITYHKNASMPFNERFMTWKNETTDKAKRLFFEKISLAASTLLKVEKDTILDQVTNHSSLEGIEEESDAYDDEITLQSDLSRPGRQIFVVTTAAIPWFTGTAVNPLLRAAYLYRLTRETNQRAENERLGRNESDVKMKNSGSGDNMHHRMVTLVIPWLELEEDRLELYGSKHNFTTPEEQELYIRKWLLEQADLPLEADEKLGLKIIFYPARYHFGLKSIFAMGDITALLDIDPDVDVCILEEPEHLNAYRAPGDGNSWTAKFNFVVGIIHTNYVEYASAHYSGLWSAPAIRVLGSAMVRAYCHVVIKLSDTLQEFAIEKERTSNVHGVRSEFLVEGVRRENEAKDKSRKERDLDRNEEVGHTYRNLEHSDQQRSEDQTDVYFIGKILWTKGLDKLLELEDYYRQHTGNYFAINIYGNGPEEEEIKRAFHGRNFESKPITSMPTESKGYDDNKSTDLGGQKLDINEETPTSLSTHLAKLTNSIELDLPKSLHEWRKTPIPAKFPGRVDHATLVKYKVFVNPSLSEVLCTTTAEALAMGKWVVIPVHPSNTFFMQFPNCLSYKNKLEFAANLHWALSHDPEPLTPEEQRLFSWEAATERLLEASAITRGEARERQRKGTSKLDERIAWFHNEVGKGLRGDKIRKILGGGPVSDQVRYSRGFTEESTEVETENQDGGLSIKFVGSALAEAMKNTLFDAMDFLPSGSTT